MILPAQLIRKVKPVDPFCERTEYEGMTYGLSPAGYDVRIADFVELEPGDFQLVSTMERFHMPTNLIGQVCDKSTWARQGLAVQNTIIEPGWSGYLTLELTNHSQYHNLIIRPGMPIAQIIFMRLVEPTEEPYNGKYQSQMAGPQPAIFGRTKIHSGNE